MGLGKPGAWAKFPAWIYLVVNWGPIQPGLQGRRFPGTNQKGKEKILINYEVRQITAKEGKTYIWENHYSHGSSKSPSLWVGLFLMDKLIGVSMFACPCSEYVRSSIFGMEYKSRVTELHRLHILDVTPKNTESWFIAKSLKLLKHLHPDYWAVISFSDLTEGHTGVIYQAANAYRIGNTLVNRKFYVDQNKRIHHPRQCGINITQEKALEFGWTIVTRASKNRYLWLLPDSKKHKKQLIELCKYDLKNQKFN